MRQFSDPRELIAEIRKLSDRRINWPSLAGLLFSIFVYFLPTPKGREWADYGLLLSAALNALSLIVYWRRPHD